MANFAKHVLDKFLAPSVSSFTDADIPDQSSASSHWLDKHFLNNVLRRPYQNNERLTIFNYLRRVEGAFRAHAEARSLTCQFLEGSRQSLSTYMAALLEWEAFLAQSWMACALLNRLGKVVAFQKNDGSTLQRLNALYNRSKHVDSAIEAGQIPPDGTTLLWMSNDGLQSVDEALSWSETGEILQVLAMWANALEDPLTACDKIEKLVGED